MTPTQLCAGNSEHGHQRALFAWRNMAERYGFVAASDELTFSAYGHAQTVYGINARQEPLPSGKGLKWVDDGGRCPVPELRWLHAIPNGGKRDAATAAALKNEGVMRGIADVCLPLPMRAVGSGFFQYAGLYIELKRPKSARGRKGATSEVQDEFIGYARRAGYAASVCFTWEAAVNDLTTYIEECRRRA